MARWPEAALFATESRGSRRTDAVLCRMHLDRGAQGCAGAITQRNLGFDGRSEPCSRQSRQQGCLPQQPKAGGYRDSVANNAAFGLTPTSQKPGDKN